MTIILIIIKGIKSNLSSLSVTVVGPIPRVVVVAIVIVRVPVLLPVMLLEMSSVLIVVIITVRVILVHVDEIGAHTGHGRSVDLRLWRMTGSGVAQRLAIPATTRWSGLVVGVHC